MMVQKDQPPLDFGSDLSISSRDITAWEAEVTDLGRQIEKLHDRRGLLEKRIETARALFALLGPVSSASITDEPTASVDLTEVPMIDAVLAGVEEAGRIAPQDLKDHLLKGPVGPRLETSDKGFYHGISRLIGRGAIKKHNGWLFSKDRYQDFSRALANGEVLDEPAPSSSRRSPLGEEIEAFVTVHPGAKSRDIIGHLKDHPEFGAGVQINPTNAYNVIARLVKRGQLRKADDGSLVVANAVKA